MIHPDFKPTYRFIQGAGPHLYWIELYSDNNVHECVVVKHARDGSVIFIKTNELDAIDRDRLARILNQRNAHQYEVAELMAQTTLPNGVNALVYFNNLARMITPTGRIMELREGVHALQSAAGVQRVSDLVQAPVSAPVSS